MSTEPAALKNIAEILGWHRLDDPYGEVIDAWTRDDRDWDWDDRYGDTPTVDDLLAWLLAGRYEVVDCHSYECADGTLGHVVTVGNDSRDVEHRAPTLLAALELAVRAVAD